jgi:hypothetical protein
MINTYKYAVITVDESQWVMIYNDENKIITMTPQQCAGTYTCADTLVVADTLEECEQYIVDNRLVYNEPVVEPETLEEV